MARALLSFAKRALFDDNHEIRMLLERRGVLANMERMDVDEVVEHAQQAADTAAERIIALGLPVDGRIGTVASRATTPELKPGFQQWEVTVREVVAQIDAVLATVYRAVDGLEDVDPVSQDLVIAIAQQFDKDRWFLYSHFAE